MWWSVFYKKLAVLSVRWRGFHAAEKKKEKKYKGDCDTMLVRNLTLYVCVCHGRAFPKWNTTASRGNDGHADRETDRKRKVKTVGGGEMERYGCCGYNDHRLCTIYLAAD